MRDRKRFEALSEVQHALGKNHPALLKVIDAVTDDMEHIQELEKALRDGIRMCNTMTHIVGVGDWLQHAMAALDSSANTAFSPSPTEEASE